ncbi:aminodeoxychorismate synthase component I [Plantactinospora sp. BC1]|uniref:chorismate-binding protein n=1 Tax=Plantactinospora sp. BC1 TaxID=2108470 RepID=UPI000D175751|nr:chorismate-binding protein [Plantactinospora sp. BC1]AVT28755.1 aminodeoxychorismate synthase component I [Plantactinospora sp. BC1]
MRQIQPYVVEALPFAPPGAPASCVPRLVEHDRLQCPADGPDDPATLLEEFLAGHGLPVHDLTRPGVHPPDGPAGTVCGAAVFVSAAAGARMVGAAAGPASPAPAVPDLVAVVYRHGTAPAAGRTRRHPVHDHRIRFDGVHREADAPWELGPWTESWTPQRHADAVRQARDAIAAGEIYQVNVVGHGSARYAGDPLPALARLARLPGARYGGVLTGPGWAIGCASPETLVEVTDGRVYTRPIKGTRPATGPGRRELLESAKERAEHVMIVDLERNDLARIARTGTVRVDELYAIRRWSNLWQAESTVSATLADGRGLADLLRAVCPGGSVTGAPKLAALAQIAALEPVGRGASMGGLGWIGPDRIDLGLTIRTVAVDAERVHVWAGGGITWGSDPAAEVAEAAAKSGPVRAILAGPR